MAFENSRVCLPVCLFLVSFVLMTSAEVLVSTQKGQVRGLMSETSLKFLGIPFARPPTGMLRWRSPMAPRSWDPRIYEATSAPPGCPQKNCEAMLPSGSCPETTSEDCLYLNVWTPLDATPESSYPVMVTFTASGFRNGHASSPEYDGNNLANSSDVIVVVVNHRLGLLGFLYTGNGMNDAEGNYGIQDQRMALQWVQDNIGQFGGDPQRVTIIGSSAGGQSVDIHMKSPRSQGLFQQAIIHGAPFDVPYMTKQQALSQSRSLKRTLRCTIGNMMCLRFRSVNAILDAQEQLSVSISTSGVIGLFEPTRPIIDGEDIVEQPMEASRQGRYSGIPTLIGTSKDEARSFVYKVVGDLPLQLPVPLPYIMYAGVVVLLRPLVASSILDTYPEPSEGIDMQDTLSELLTDYIFTCPTRYLARNMTQAANGQGIYRFVFDFDESSAGISSEYLEACAGYTCHGIDPRYVFGNLNVNATEQDEELSRSVMSYWTNFVHTGNPNNGGSDTRLDWPAYDPSQDSTMLIGVTDNNLLSDYRGQLCDFWDELGYDN